MKLTSFVITLLCSLKISSAIRCYSCEVERAMAYTHAPTCDHFNGSDISVTNCPNSTMCTKRVTTQEIGPRLSSTSVRRGCAAQTTPGLQEKVGRKWVQLNTIYEVYEETCIEDPNNKHKLTKTLLCFCRGDLCNTAGKISIIPSVLLIALEILTIV